MPIKSMRGASPPDTHGSSRCSSTGETIADDAAKITIKPTATGTLARAIPANGGPKGAPGQTARMRNPAATAGLAANKMSSTMAAPGTKR